MIPIIAQNGIKTNDGDGDCDGDGEENKFRTTIYTTNLRNFFTAMYCKRDWSWVYY